MSYENLEKKLIWQQNFYIQQLEEQLVYFCESLSVLDYFAESEKENLYQMIQHMEKQNADFPRPANRVTHSSINKPVIHISTNAGYGGIPSFIPFL